MKVAALDSDSQAHGVPGMTSPLFQMLDGSHW